MMTLIHIILLVILLLSMYIYLIGKSNYWKIRNVPHENTYPFIGSFLNIVLGKQSVGKYLEKMYNNFDGPYFGFIMMNKPYLVLRDPNLIKRILVKDFNSFPNRFFAYNLKADSLMSNSLLAIKSPQWKSLRSKLSPVFTSGKMKMMLPLLGKCGEYMQNHIIDNLNKSVDAKEIAAKFTTDVISTYAFGISANSFVCEDSGFRAAGRKISENSFKRAFSVISYSFAPFLVNIFSLKFLHAEAMEFLRRAFIDTIQERERKKIKRNDLIDILITIKNNEITNDNFQLYGDRLIAQAATFFFAGYETTSSTIAFSLHELSVNQEIQERLRKELLDVIDHHGGLTYEAVQSMKYLDMVVSETLRKHTLTPFLQRECVENYEIPETGLLIERGMGIVIPLHGLHRDPKYFPNPGLYDPERFSDENRHENNLDAFLPLGKGPRNCIGERFGLLVSKLGIIYIITKFRVERNSDTQEPLVYYRTHHLRTAKGLPLTFREL